MIVRLQTELAIRTHVAVTDIHEDVANTRELVSDMHRTMLKGQEGVDNRNHMVGNHGILFMVQKYLQLPQTQARFAIQTIAVDLGPYL